MLESENRFLDAPVSRRHLLAGGLAALGAFALPGMVNEAFAARLSLPRDGAYKISFRNTHTGESFSGAYRVGNRYLPEAFEDINYVLRDFRTNEVFPIDPRVIDIIYATREKTGVSSPFDVLSGYRSPRTNNMLRSGSKGVAKNSLHLTGQAIDIRLPGYSTRRLRDVGVSLRAGGVGYYARSNFVHMDTGKFRTW